MPHSCKRRLLLCWLCCSLIRRLLLLHLNGICRRTSQMLLRGSFSKRSTGQTGQRVTFTFTILYMIADDARLMPPHCKKHTGQWVDGSMGPQVNGSNGSTGQRVTFTFTILYMIADDARLTPPCCKKHTAYDDTRLMPHRCKKHTVSFARSTGEFPSKTKMYKSKFSQKQAGSCNLKPGRLIYLSSAREKK